MSAFVRYRFALATCGVALILFWLYSRHVSWPHEYHNDEPSKTRQIISGERNLRHPPLMLEVTSFALKMSGQEWTRQNAALCGRWLSALLVASACAALGGLLVRSVPSMISILVGLLVGLQPGVFESAHYLKEDSWFLAGIVAVLWGMQGIVERASLGRLLLLGLALGLAVSTKYAAWSLLPMAAGLAWARAGCKAAASVVACACVVAALCITPSLLASTAWASTVPEEMRWMFGGHFGIGHQIPHGIYLLVLYHRLTLLVLLPACAAGAGYVLACRRNLVWRLVAAYAATLVIVLSFLSKTSDRYLLPVLLVLLPLAWLAVHRSSFYFGGRLRTAWCCGWLALWAAVILPQFKDRFEAFSQDSRAELVAWMRSHIASAKIVQDAKVNLNLFEQQDSWTLGCSSFFAADCGTLPQLQAQGFTHAAVSWDVHHRYVEEYLRSDKSELSERRGSFYRALHADMPLLWQSPARDPKALHPGLFLFELAAP